MVISYEIFKTITRRARTSSARALRGAMLATFESHVDHRLYIRRLVVAAADTLNKSVQLDMITDYEALENDSVHLSLSSCFRRC